MAGSREGEGKREGRGVREHKGTEAESQGRRQQQLTHLHTAMNIVEASTSSFTVEIQDVTKVSGRAK